eukprot:714556-Prymnesium_polylepis.1
MYEAWQPLMKSHAMDSFVMGCSGFGEQMGPRCSDFYAALRLHFEASLSSNGDVWSRSGGKNNQELARRKRTQDHAQGCPMRSD